MDQTLSVAAFGRIMKKHWRILLNSTVAGIVLALIVTFIVMTPKYQSQTQVVVSLPKTASRNGANDVSNNLQLVNTYKEFVTGDVVLERSSQALAKMGIKRSSARLKKEIKVTQPQNSLMFTITVTDTSRYDAKVIADTVSDSFRNNVTKYISVSKIAIVSQAQLAQAPATPKKSFNLMIGLAFGIVAGIILALLLEMTDLTVKDEEFIKDKLGLPIIGYVSQISLPDLQKTTRIRSFAADEQAVKPQMSRFHSED
ncbi:YveK family protein [Bombilactobacillus thymidiniphilus]|uniref:Capsular polysaccharide biosynthesis protein CpsC n=1 Tax=Bombilactobacillus thymidiniphilus TaxID=2923363 RepID=A0ABY4PCL7_9LACO|nr:Wzz/FepE/Etk N-terminal domain-containing protein [Bombilactobacillus thymidiniphilus]UQS83287.1 Wzz/FepE/Etk N-terminal domain-containing protein [Bombilactobacillus thymidiniphilus]